MNPDPARPRSYFEKVWDDHVIAVDGDSALLQIDRLFLHEATGAVSLRELRGSGRVATSPRQVYTAIDHLVSLDAKRRAGEGRNPVATAMIAETLDASHRDGIRAFDVGDPRQGIVHVISPELGLALPGTTLVCGDSHTCTVGGLGTLGWGIGASEAVHVLATQTLWQSKPRPVRIRFDGRLGPGVGAKDIALFLIGQIGADAGQGLAVEFSGSTIRALSVEGRLTLCNMGAEFAARYVVVAPDDVAYQYLQGREYAPQGAAWESALAYWRTLASDDDAVFAHEFAFDVSTLAPQVTWGTGPQHVVGIDGVVPDPVSLGDAEAATLARRALAYQRLHPGVRVADIAVDVAYIGSCTNARLPDLVEAAGVLRGRKIAPGVRALCVPGSSTVKRDAEALGLDRVFRAAGFEWLESGCALCAAGEVVEFADRRVISTTNRNFENRQGPATRTHLASPAVVAASAVAGRIADPRSLARH